MSFIYDLADSWNSAGTTFTAIKMNVTNTASAVGSKLIDLQIGGTSQFVVSKSGSVGVGTASPNIANVSNAVTVNTINGTTGAIYEIGINGTNYAYLFANVSNTVLSSVQNTPLLFNTNNTERMRLDTNGNLGVGTTSITGNATNRVIVSQGADSANVIVTKTGAQSGSLVAFDVGILVGSDTNHPLLFKTNAAERMRIDSTGYISLGTGAAIQDSLLVFSGSISGTPFRRGIKLGTDPDGQFDFYINSNQNNSMFRWINGNGSAELMRLNSAGNLGLGVTPSAWASSVRALELPTGSFYSYASGSTSVFYMMSNAYFNGTNNIYKTSAAATQYAHFGGAHQWFNAPAGTAGNAITFTQAMTLNASGNLAIGSTTANRAGASQGLSVEGSSTTVIEANRNNGRAGYMYVDGLATAVGEFRNLPLVFNTNDTERARITAAGELLVGTSTAQGGLATDAVGVTLYGGTAKGTSVFTRDSVNPVMYINNKTSTGGLVQFYNGGNNVGSITSNGTGVTYGTASDARLKENIADADDAADLIDAIQVRKFDWKADGLHQRYGMVAQELLEVAPEAVSVPADENEMMGVDYSKLVPMLIKEVQSLRARVAQLEGN